MCDEKVEVYSRVVGYFRPISNWNEGKQEEFRDRKFFNLKQAAVATAPKKSTA